MNVGTENIVDAYGCTRELLRDIGCIQFVCQTIIEDLSLTIVGSPQWYQFPDPFGVTGMYLLSESHLTCHTFPEFGTATFNLYCCRKQPDWAWEIELKIRLGAEYVDVRTIQRAARVEGCVHEAP